LSHVKGETQMKGLAELGAEKAFGTNNKRKYEDAR
jgi:hypothetical protein